MDDEQIPDDFPVDAPTPFALCGVQPKLNLVQGGDGRLHQLGAEPGSRLLRYQESLAEIEMCVELLEGKLLKPKYQALTREEILTRLKVNLIRDRLMSAAESDWILTRVASRKACAYATVPGGANPTGASHCAP